MVLTRAGRVLFKQRLDLSPEQALNASANLPAGTRPQELMLALWSAEGEVLVRYIPEPQQAQAIPEPAQAIAEPAQIESNEALFLAGLHLEQYRHATREPESYYREALRRDPSDIRNNNALGALLLRRGQFAKAEPFFRDAIQTQTRHNPNPQEGEPYYNLGLCLRYQGRLDEAYDAFAKAAWNAAWQDAAFLQLAQLDLIRGKAGSGAEISDKPVLSQALEFTQRSLARNAANQKAAHLEIVLYRKLGKLQQAREGAEAALEFDPLDFGARHELALLGDTQEIARLSLLMRGNEHSSLEIAADYAHAGFYAEALELLAAVGTADSAHREERPGPAADELARAPGHLGETGMPNLRPMVSYFLAYYAFLKGDPAAASSYWREAARQPAARCFPNSLDSILALQAALRFNPKDARAAFYLGNLWCDKRQVREATACWETAARYEPSLPTPHRNLALVYFNKQQNPKKALRALERAFGRDPTDARVLFELDLLRKRDSVPPEKRFEFLEHYRTVVEQREDLLLEYITLLNFFGRFEEALERLLHLQFHPWEGGEGKVTGQYVVSLTEMAKQKLMQARRGARSPGRKGKATATAPEASICCAEAIDLLNRARCYPHNLGEGKLHGAQENQILYWLGCAQRQLGKAEEAARFWREAATGMKVPTPAVYYNDQNPETIFYQGLALAKLGRPSAAKERFETLVRFAKEHCGDEVVIDYFAVSLPEFMVFDDDLNRRNAINCHYLAALGQLGLGRKAQAIRGLTTVLKLDPAHQPARLHLNGL